MEGDNPDETDHAIVLDEEDTQVEEPAQAAPKTEETRDERMTRLREAINGKQELNPEPETEDDDGEDPAPEVEDEPEEAPAAAAAPETTKADPGAIDYVDGASMPKEVWKALPKEAKPAFRAMRDALIRERHEKSVLETQVKAEKAHADYGRELATFAQTHKITPEGMQEVLGAAALINAGDPTAVDWLIGYAKKLGYQEPTVAAPSGPKSKLEKLRDEGVISDEDYRDLAKDIRPTATERPRAALPEVKVPRHAAAASPEEQIKAAQTKLAQQDAAMAAKYGSDWAKVLRPQVEKELARFKGAPPEQWPALMDQSVRVVVSTLRSTKRKPAATDPALATSAPVRRSVEANQLEGRARVKALARRGTL